MLNFITGGVCAAQGFRAGGKYQQADKGTYGAVEPVYFCTDL